MAIVEEIVKDIVRRIVRGVDEGLEALIPFFSDLNTWYKRIVGTIFNEKINNLPARFLPRVAKFDNASNDFIQLSSIINIGKVHTIIINLKKSGGASFIGSNGSTNNFLFFDSPNLYYRINGTSYSVSYTLLATDREIKYIRNGTSIEVFVDNDSKGITTLNAPDNIDYTFDQIGARTSGLFYDGLMSKIEINSTDQTSFLMYPTGQGGFDYDLVSGTIYGTWSGTGTHYDFDLNGSTRPNDVGYSIWRKAANPDIQVQFDINGAALSLTAGVNIPAGYSHERDVPAGGDKHNIYKSLVDFDPDGDGVEKAINGKFTAWTADNPDNWTVGGESGSDPMVTQVGNACRIFTSAGINTNITQNVLTIGVEYTVEIEITASVSGNIVVLIGNVQFQPIGVGTYSFTAIALNTTLQIKRQAGSTDVTFTNISAKAVLPISILDRESIIYQTPTSRASLFYDADHPFVYHIDEISDPRNSDTFFMPDFKNIVFQKVRTIGQEISRLDEVLNYKNKKIGADLVKVQRYCGISDLLIQFSLLSTGDGTGVSTITLTVSENMTLTLDGAGKFYTDAGGTANESSTWDITTGAARTMYLKVTSGTSLLSIPKNKIIEWNTWTSSTNAATLSGDISKLSVLTFLQIRGLNTIYGNIALLTNLIQIDLRSLTAVSGLITGLTSLITMIIQGLNTVSGSVTGLTSLTLINMAGFNTISGDLNPIVSDLTGISLNPCAMDTYTAGATWGNATITIVPTGTGYDTTEIDNMLIDMAASVALISKTITLTGTSAARTAASDAAVATLEGGGRNNTVITNP